jgi:tRNA (adenine22-N1)-methyltransferase
LLKTDTFRLSKRLGSIAKLTAWEDGSGDGFEKSAADIGCDHGHLAASLVLNGAIAIASDIHHGPLNAAAETFRRLGISSKVDLRLGDGLSVLSPGEAHTCFICGMGGMNIISILKAEPQVVNSFKQMILSPHRDIRALRRFLHTIGFNIKREVAIEDRGHIYTAIDARKRRY